MALCRMMMESQSKCSFINLPNVSSLSVYHLNAVTERSFSIDKKLVEAHGNLIQEKRIVAIC